MGLRGGIGRLSRPLVRGCRLLVVGWLFGLGLGGCVARLFRIGFGLGLALVVFLSRARLLIGGLCRGFGLCLVLVPGSILVLVLVPGHIGTRLLIMEGARPRLVGGFHF